MKNLSDFGKNSLCNGYLFSPNLVSNSMFHGFFGRIGGVSSGHYASLNCSKYVGDNNDSVEKNLKIVKDFLGVSKLVLMRQMHGNVCVQVIDGSEDEVEADAMVTMKKGIAIGVVTADCAPILFCDMVQNVVGAAHAGWKGAASGIIESTIEKMLSLGSDIMNIKAAIGPCIGKNSYAVSEDFRNNFPDQNGCFHLINTKVYFDLSKYCFKRLCRLGLQEENINVLDVDTCAENKRYFSYRFARERAYEVCGRNLSAIYLR